jgi:hypothetical protein
MQTTMANSGTGRPEIVPDLMFGLLLSDGSRPVLHG